MLRMDPHYDEGQLTTAADGEFDAIYGEGSEALLRTHLTSCSRCAETMAGIVKLKEFVSKVMAVLK